MIYEKEFYCDNCDDYFHSYDWWWSDNKAFAICPECGSGYCEEFINENAD